MVLGLLVALLATTAVLVVTLRDVVDRTPNPFRVGWPVGVQEDDDLQWSWSPGASAAAGALPSPARAVTQDDDDVDGPPALEVELTPLAYEVRSADRARS